MFAARSSGSHLSCEANGKELVQVGSHVQAAQGEHQQYMDDENMACVRTMQGRELSVLHSVNQVVKPVNMLSHSFSYIVKNTEANPRSVNCQMLDRINYGDTLSTIKPYKQQERANMTDTRGSNSSCPILDLNVYDRLSDYHYIGGLRSHMKLRKWQLELSLSGEFDGKDYLLQGITHGFPIVDPGQIPRYKCSNYSSCREKNARLFFSRLFREEESQGIIVPTSIKPHCVHAIGALKKKDSSFRPITDCRCPVGSSINNYMSTTCQPFKYNSLDIVCDRLSRGDFMCSTDIKAAYRSISILPEHRKFQGFKWTDENGRSSYYYDTRLSFGLKCAPYIFNTISDFIVCCMMRRGYSKIINYLDDYFCWGSSYAECASTQHALIQLLGQLGFRVAWNKCTSPSTTCIFLGIEINSLDMSMSLPRDK